MRLNKRRTVTFVETPLAYVTMTTRPTKTTKCRTIMASTEKETQKSVMEYLKWKKVFHFRVNSGAVVGEYKGNRRFFKFSTPGCPDIIAVIKGKFVGLEIKDVKGKLNANQEAFKSELEKAGGKYLTVKSLDDVIKAGI